MFSRTVDVLTADLSAVAIDEDSLGVAELGRALGIATSKSLRGYLAAHTWLRQQLGNYIGCPAGDIRFTAGEHGKPTIESPATDLSFSFSYSGGLAALAVGFRMEVGIDLEVLEGVHINTETVRRVMSHVETSAILNAPDMRREYLKLWVRKEALAKATGVGVDPDMETSNVMGLSPVVRDGFDIVDVNLGDGHVAAVAIPSGCTVDLTVVLEASVTSSANVAVPV